ncbi:cupin domain-containing protein [Marivibrio halodurans]|uniref:Cupin domain-containing protein n=1 Tax=Marivibrio halodurans TaxID=2039722 RepID=A0A8J7V484_9PROT|nr:cupin domain-containing protein [Marivibrio halodurans]MBP5857404.1 cupin domain-containing protein [Marivibrio halodurans]
MADARERFPSLDPETLTPRQGTTAYPPAFRAVCDGRAKRALGTVFALTQFGVNLTELAPGAATAQRHWHEAEDEFVYVLSGTATLVNDAGETDLPAGHCAGFPAGRADGHMIVNRTERPVRLLEVGTRAQADRIHYPDIDLFLERGVGAARCTRKDGTAY